MDDLFERAIALKQSLTDFVLDAEGELATALESYSAVQLAQVAQSPAQNLMPYDMVIESFLTTGKVGDKTPIDLFLDHLLDHEPELTEGDRHLIQQWHRSFPGLFEVVQILPNGLELKNWLTAKQYPIYVSTTPTAKLSPGEILLTYLTPVGEISSLNEQQINEQWINEQWICSKIIGLGKLGKPKLAVAIGNFKQCYGKFLYSDAPDLLAEAWRSVEQYHQDFTDFFGTDELTLPGYQWAKKLEAFQEVLTQRRLAAAGIDSSKTLSQLAEEADLPPEEMAELRKLAEAEKSPTKMVTPTVELPNPLKKAEHVTALTHPRWGQNFLSTYWRLKTVLETQILKAQTLEAKTLEAQPLEPDAQALFLQCLQDAQVNTYVWQRLAQQYPVPLEQILQSALARPTFNLKTDLDRLLQEFNKPLEPTLPEIASVPLHLHELFQEALLEVSKDKSKSKVKRKSATGFQS